MKAYLTRHLQVLITTLGDFARNPAATLLTVAMIGVTLALPTGLYVGLLNLQRFSHGWRGQGSLSVYLKKDVSGAPVTEAIKRVPGVISAYYISPAQGLQQFEAQSGLGRALGVLHGNPLPGVVEVTPKAATAASLTRLATQITSLNGVARVQSNLAWLERLDAALALGHRLVMVMATLLGLALILILSNTTRAAVASRATEIDIIGLVGGTQAFIRRPFLYAGAMTGALGALCALLLIEVALLALSGPVDTLDALYASHYTLSGLAGHQALALVALGGGLGWIGARIAVGHRLRKTPN